jgi:hypothetical protein
LVPQLRARVSGLLDLELRPDMSSAFFDLPDCATYQGGQDLGRACVPEKGASMNSVFRATNYPVGGVNPRDPSQVVVSYGSYLSRTSNETNGCVPQGFSPTTGQSLYAGVKTEGASIFWGDYAGLAVRDTTALPLWSDTRDRDLFTCQGTATPGNPPRLCGATEANGVVANDQDVFVDVVDIPQR